MDLEYPTLRLNQQRLHEMMQQIYKNNETQPQGSFYQLPELARCLYYLRDPQAADYLRQAAQKQAPSIEYKTAMIDYEAERINWYRLAGDQATMQRLYLQLLYKATKADNSDYVRYQVQIFEAHFWLGNDRECIRLYQQDSNLQEWSINGWIAQIAEARLTNNQQLALEIARRCAREIRAERFEPWDYWAIYWDLYEICCGLLNPPLNIDQPLVSDDPLDSDKLIDLAHPAERLLALLQAEQIISLEWAIYNNHDEAEVGYRLYRLSDGTSKPLSEGFINQELERLVWDFMNFDWAGALPEYQPHGVYQLDIANAMVNYVGMIWNEYDYAEEQAYESNSLLYPVTVHPANPELYVMYLPEDQHQGVDVAFWHGEQRGY
ncbi:hypothetical protein [Herpetosiphon geysericola]|uniref:Uncharacterized protein n=1 Tax=Herpetosiphon geysericola TaxID=70996 RepID=A0A0P6YKY6_9CHLR|nr:hypothetical protein [Herpetosiphon geysericola]KPL85889.1 hypothetical protein SE18_13295 [Herpetosiphon geysericola]